MTVRDFAKVNETLEKVIAETKNYSEEGNEMSVLDDFVGCFQHPIRHSCLARVMNYLTLFAIYSFAYRIATGIQQTSISQK